jgi:hypothetical protein
MSPLDGAALGIVEALQQCRSAAACPCAGMPKTVTCGGNVCEGYQPPPPNPIADPCCGGMQNAQCGLDPAPLFGPDTTVACLPLNQPGPPTPACPSYAPDQPPYNGATLEGCCRPMDGTCGYADDVTGLGCIPAGLFGISNPPTCTP